MTTVILLEKLRPTPEGFEIITSILTPHGVLRGIPVSAVDIARDRASKGMLRAGERFRIHEHNHDNTNPIINMPCKILPLVKPVEPPPGLP